MKKQTLFLLLFFSSFLALEAQDPHNKYRWSIKAGYSSYPGLFVSVSGIKQSYGNYRIEANYGLLNFLETGLYLGYSRTTSYMNPAIDPTWVYKNLNTPYFGVNLNFHPLTFLIKKPDFRFDLYLLARYGGVYYFSPQAYIPAKGLQFQYQHGAGLGFSLSKHFGIFGEYSYGVYGVLAKPSENLRYGLSVKF
jgi:hypothetical protein